MKRARPVARTRASSGTRATHARAPRLSGWKQAHSKPPLTSARARTPTPDPAGVWTGAGAGIGTVCVAGVGAASISSVPVAIAQPPCRASVVIRAEHREPIPGPVLVVAGRQHGEGVGRR